MSDEEFDYEKDLWQSAAREEGAGRASAYVNLARIAFDRGKFNEALAMCETARDIYEGQSVDHYRLFDVNLGIARSYEKLQRFTEAADAMGKAVDAARIIDHEDLDDLLRDHGRYWYGANEYEKSIECHQEAMSISQLHMSNESPEMDYFNIGLGLQDLKRYPEAIEAFKKSRAAYKELGEIANAVDCDYRLTQIFAELENAVEIIHYGQPALDFYTVLNIDRRVWTLKYFLGIAHRILGDLPVAGELFDQARNLAQAMGWNEWEFLIKVDKECAQIYRANGLVDEAEEILRRVKSIESLAAKEQVYEAA